MSNSHEFDICPNGIVEHYNSKHGMACQMNTLAENKNGLVKSRF